MERYPKILVVGNTGAGKSTLIERIVEKEYHTGEKTMISFPVTQQPKKHTMKDKEGIVTMEFWDMKGFELGKESESSISQMNEVLQKENFDVVWYLLDVPCHRIENYFGQMVNMFGKELELTVLVVLSKCDMVQGKNDTDDLPESPMYIIDRMRSTVEEMGLENIGGIYHVSSKEAKRWHAGVPRLCSKERKRDDLIDDFTNSFGTDPESIVKGLDRIRNEDEPHVKIVYDEGKSKIYCHDCNIWETGCDHCDDPDLYFRGDSRRPHYDCMNCGKKSKACLMENQVNLLLKETNSILNRNNKNSLSGTNKDLCSKRDKLNKVLELLVDDDFQPHEESDVEEEEEEEGEGDGEESEDIFSGSGKSKRNVGDFAKELSTKLWLWLSEEATPSAKKLGKEAFKRIFKEIPKILEGLYLIGKKVIEENGNPAIERKFYKGGQFMPGGGRARKGGEYGKTRIVFKK